MKSRRLLFRGVITAIVLGIALLIGIVLLASCAASKEAASTGTPAPQIKDLSAVPPTYVGTGACKDCHTTITDAFAKHGHGYKLTKVVDGQPPKFPFSAVPQTPEGYTWKDITYVIGGYGWKARFIDKNGYVITGDEKAKTQYNLRNEELNMGPGWVPYNAGKKTKYDCGPCHTTGYIAKGNKDNMEGMVGTWALEGIQCEKCHGPGGNHINNPYAFKMNVIRDAEFCGQCHSRGAVEQIDAAGGFIQHHEQYEELFQSKHRALNCVACHNPHTTVKYAAKAGISPVRVNCDSCHFREAIFSAVNKHSDVKCAECHMPKVVKSAYSDSKSQKGDIRAHFFAFNAYAKSQFSEDGKFANPYATVESGCNSCHYAGGPAQPKPIDVMRATAIGYHKPK